MDKNQVKISQILEVMKKALACRQKLIAKYSGLNESTISSVTEKTIGEAVSNKSGRRLVALYYVINSLAGKGLSPEGIKESINEFVFEDLDGFSDSVVSALLEDKYKLNVLLKIADMGYDQYRAKLAKRDLIFSDVKDLVLAAAIWYSGMPAIIVAGI